MPRRRGPICDKLLTDPERQQSFQQLVNERPIIPARVDINTHCSIITEYTAEALALCFPTTPQPYKPWISQAIWDMINARRPWKQLVLEANAAQRSLAKSACFNVWARKHQPARSDLIFDDHAVAYAQALLNKSSYDLRCALRHDTAACIRSLQAECADAAARHDSRAFYELTKTFAGRKPARQVPTRFEDGTTARTPTEARDRWRRHFADVHCGTTATPTDLLTATESDPHTAIAPDAHFLPTLVEVVGAFGQAERRKAPGIDAIPPDALAALPNKFAILMHPLMLKCALTMNEPVLWKGGVLTTFPKHSGASQTCADFREIALGCIVAKSYHRLMRRRLTPHFTQSVHQTQCGGIDGRSTNFATQYIRTALHRAQRGTRTSIAIFVDVIATFYTLVREAVLLLPNTRDRWRDFWASTGRDPHEFEDLMGLLDEPCAFKTKGIPDHLGRVIAAAHSGTWLSTDNDDLITAFRLGVLPGDPYGDIVFTFLATVCLEDIRAELDAAGLTPPPSPEPVSSPLTDGEPWPDSAPVDVSCVYDASFNIDAETAEKATENTRAACDIIANVDRLHPILLQAQLQARQVRGAHLPSWAGNHEGQARPLRDRQDED